MFLRVHAATSLCYGLRLSRIRCVNVIGWLLGEITWPSKSKTQKIFYMHSWMLGFSLDLFHAFCNVGIRTRLDIMYIVLQHILCLSYRRLDLSMLLGKVCSRELPRLAISSSAQTTRRISRSISNSRAWGLDTKNYSMWLPWLAWLAGSGAGSCKNNRCWLMWRLETRKILHRVPWLLDP